MNEGKKKRRAAKLTRVAAVVGAMQTPEFLYRLDAATETAGDAARSLHDIREMVHKALGAMGVSYSGVAITIAWDPSARKLDLWARPKVAARKLSPLAGLRAVGPAERPSRSA